MGAPFDRFDVRSTLIPSHFRIEVLPQASKNVELENEQLQFVRDAISEKLAREKEPKS